MKIFSLVYDKDYGIDKKTGWTTCLNGSVVIELERFLFITLLKTLFKIIAVNY